MKTKLLLFVAVLVAALCSGCVSTEYHGKDGVSFKRVAFGNRQSIGKVEFDPSTGKVKIEGYSNEQTELAAAVAQAVASALTPKPPAP